MSHIDDYPYYDEPAQTRFPNCSCRDGLLPCAFCRGAAVPVPDRINEVVAALAQQPHITQPGAVPVPGTAAHISIGQAQANAMLAAEDRCKAALTGARAQAADRPSGYGQQSVLAFIADNKFLRDELAAAEARIIGVEDALAAERGHLAALTIWKNELRGALAAELLLHRDTQARLAETRARLATPATPLITADRLQPEADTPGLFIQCETAQQRAAIMRALTGQPGTNPGAGEVVEPRVTMESLGIAFVDPDPPATPKVMPANALRTPRRDGWKMLT